MNLKYSELNQWTVKTTDGQERPIADFLIDDWGWRVRYAVIDTGGWLHNRQILISPAAFGKPDYRSKVLPIKATLAQMELSPPLEAHVPITLAHERALDEYYEWPPREVEGNVLPPSVVKHLTPDTEALQDRTIDRKKNLPGGDRGLWSAGAIKDMNAVTREGELASIDDILFRDDPWQIEGWVVDARPWMPGGQATLGPGAVGSVNVDKGRANLTLERTEIEGLSAAQDNLAHMKR